MGVSSLESHNLTGFIEMFMVSPGALPKIQIAGIDALILKTGI